MSVSYASPLSLTDAQALFVLGFGDPLSEIADHRAEEAGWLFEVERLPLTDSSPARFDAESRCVMKRHIDICLDSRENPVGELRYDRPGRRKNAAFAYTSAWLADDDRFPVLSILWMIICTTTGFCTWGASCGSLTSFPMRFRSANEQVLREDQGTEG